MYYGLFKTQDDICSYFQISSEDLKGCKILFAAYECEYEGEALVVFRHKRKLYEVNGSHCSCYGLEDQWTPELTNVEALRHRFEKGTLGYFLGGYAGAFNTMLDLLTRKGKPVSSN
jgi:hypothetical protein